LNRIPLFIDTDPGVDDALALLMAFASTRHQLLGLGIAAGNVGLDHTVANALKLCEVAGVSIPVYPGCDRPLVIAPEDAAYVHGCDGFGDTGYTPATRQAESEHAALAIIREAKAHEGKLLLVTLGPLTNLALALRLDPGLPRRIARLVVMGGAVTGKGNTNVTAEFNVAFDPEAAAIVFEAFDSVEVVDWELVLRHGFAHVEFERWLASGGVLAEFYGAISQKTRLWAEGKRGTHWHSADALAMMAALYPEYVLEKERHYLAVETQGRHARGATVVDWLDRSSQPAQAQIVLNADQSAFERLIQQALGVCSEQSTTGLAEQGTSGL
jgi:purine nucleosidase